MPFSNSSIIYSSIYIPLSIINLNNFLTLKTEPILKPKPTLLVITINLRNSILTSICNSQSKASLEHEGHLILKFLRLILVILHAVVKGIPIRTMRSKSIMETRAALWKTLSFGIVSPLNISHEFTHDISMVIRKSKSVLLDSPSVFKENKIQGWDIGLYRGNAKYSKYRWVQMVIRNWVDYIEPF